MENGQWRVGVDLNAVQLLLLLGVQIGYVKSHLLKMILNLNILEM